MYLRDTTLDEQASRIFQEALYLVEEARADDDPVIARDRHPHRLTYGELAVAYDRAILDGADGENRRLRRHDHRGEVLDIEHPHVRDGERRTRQIITRKAAASRFRHEPMCRARDLRQCQPLAFVDDRHDEPVLDRNSHPNVNIRKDNDSVILEARVHPRVTA